MPAFSNHLRGSLASTIFSWRFGLLVLPAVLLVGLGLICYSAIQRLSRDTAAVERSQAALALAQDFLSCLKDAETGQRGFLLTGREYYLEPYQWALRDFDKLHQQLMSGVLETNEARRTLQRIDEYSKQKLSVLAETIRLYHQGNKAAAMSILNSDRGKNLMDRIRVLISALSEAERKSLARQSASRKRNQIALEQLVAGGGFSLFCLLVISAWFLSRDAERRLRIAAALRESEDHYRHSVELNPQIPWTATAQGDVAEVSDRWHTLTGLPREPLLNGGWVTAQHPDDSVPMSAAWNASIRTGNPFDFEHRLRLADGTYRWMRTRAFPRRNAEGTIIKWYGTSEDIGDRKAAEEELRHSHETLEQTVQERTIQLVDSNRELEAANRELETFAYTSSHDLRAPARNIDNLGQIVFEDFGSELSEPVANYIRRMRAASQKMGRLIDDLLSFSRLSRDVLEHSLVDLSAMAGRVIEELRSSDSTRNVEVYIQPEITAWGSQRLLAVALENLIGNAWKYTSTTPGARIAFTASDSVFAISDNGVGFDMRHSELLFAPFQRLHKQQEFPGTGIGLATVQRIIRRHGGSIWAESEPGKGATFRFTLPPVPKEKIRHAGQSIAAAS